MAHEMAHLYPDADIYTLLADEGVLDKYFAGRTVIQHPKIERSSLRKKYYRYLLPLYPTYIEDFDLTGYDRVISSSYLVAKGVLCRPDTLHISYIHTPMRQAWVKYHEYLRNENDVGYWSRIMLRYVLNYIRMWDVASANRVDHFIANSTVVKKRIEKIYRRKAEVIHPPVQVKNYQAKSIPDGGDSDFYITVGRLVPYKKIDLIVETFNQLPDQKLVVVGTGNDEQRLKQLAESPNIEFLGYIDEERKTTLTARARGFVFAAEEDFGISPVEAMALGTPVIAFNKGGAQDYVEENINGCFFDRQEVGSLKKAIINFEQRDFDTEQVKESVSHFDTTHFREQLKTFVENCR